MTDEGGPAVRPETDPIDTQLALQRRILETLAGREAELGAMRRAVGENDDRDEAPGGEAGGEAFARLRDRWLEAMERAVEMEERMARVEGGLPSSPAAPSPVGEDRDPDRPFAACTIVCRNYLAQARALLESLSRFEPTVRRYLLVLDADPGAVDVGPGIEIIPPRRLRLPDFPGMSFKYGVVEFNTAVKPYLLSLLMEEYDEPEVVYFDPDIFVLRRLDELRSALGTSDIVLTPHITEPIPRDGLTPTEPDIMISGAYNLGFIGLRRSEQTRRFLGWWCDRLEDGCRIDVPNGLFTDQKWIDLVPGLFDRIRILRDVTYNVAFWNLHERRIEANGDGYEVNGRPAAFVHISGFDPERPDRLSKHQTRTRVEPDSGLARLLEAYAERLSRLGWKEAQAEEYGYARFSDGVRIHPYLRKLYLGLAAEDRGALGDPFRDLGAGGFRDWATRPREESGGLSYFLQEIYAARIDLQEAFPDVRGRDRAAFIEWAKTQGPLEMAYDPGLVRSPEAETPEPAPTTGVLGPAAGPVGEGGPRHYGALVDRIRALVDDELPAGATIAVVSRGDYRLMHLGGRQVWHFPRAENGLYAGFHPRTSRDAIEHLESLRRAGADFLVFPATAFWWLDYYEEFRGHLDERYRRVVDDPGTCIAFKLERRSSNGAGRPVALGRQA